MEVNFDSLTPEKTCFVICPMGEEDSETRSRSDKLIRFIISPAAEDNGLVAVRSDLVAAPGFITSLIIRHIINDAMVVADLTDHNANVFYELALRHAFRKPVIQIVSDVQRIPFDVQAISMC